MKIVPGKAPNQDRFFSITSNFEQVYLRAALANIYKQPLVTNCTAKAFDSCAPWPAMRVTSLGIRTVPVLSVA